MSIGHVRCHVFTAMTDDLPSQSILKLSLVSEVHDVGSVPEMICIPHFYPSINVINRY